jgi:hypothetical protein
MPDRNVDVIRRAFEATLRDDWDEVVVYFDPEVETWDHDTPTPAYTAASMATSPG